MAQALVDTLSLGAVYGLFAFGLSLAWGVMNLLNLAHGAVFMLGAYTAYRISTAVDLQLLVLLPIVMVVTALLSLAIDVLVFRPLRNRVATPREAEFGMLVASVGIAAVPILLVERATRGSPVFIPPSVYQIEVYRFWGIRVTNLQILMVLLTLVLAGGLVAGLRYSRYGRALRAVSVDPDTAQLLGVHANRMFAVTMLVSGALAGLAGVLLGIHLNVVDSTMGEPLMLKAFAIVIIGGIGSVGGAIGGGFLLALFETLVVRYGASSYRDAVAFAIILLILLIWPTGLSRRGATERS